MLLQRLHSQNLIPSAPGWLPNSTHYLCQMGSVAFGVEGASSDIDLYGFCIPPKEMVFPHLAGEIIGFGKERKRFDLWEQHHVKTPDGAREYDFTIYSIVRFFSLAMENNPNMLDALFAPRRCVIHSTPLAEHVRDHRRFFLHKGAWPKHRNYAFSQMTKIREKVNSSNPKRAAEIAAFGYDLKHAYHCVRLLLQCEQILVEHDLDIERNREVLKTIRRGEWSLERLEAWFEEKERSLEEVYGKSDLRAMPDEGKIKDLLLECLEMAFGKISMTLVITTPMERLVADMRAVLDKYS